MHLRRTPFEVIIEAEAQELAKIGGRIATLGSGQSLQVASSASKAGHQSLLIRESGQPFLARWDEQLGLVVEGSIQSLQAFAEQFVFECEPQPGVHNHWDVSPIEDLIDPSSLPIVVQVK